MSRLVAAPRRIEFAPLRTDHSPPVAPHLASQRRSYLRLRSLWHTPTWTFTVLMRRLHGRTHTGEGRYPDVFEFPGFRVALAIASLPGMTFELCCELQCQDTSCSHNTQAEDWFLITLFADYPARQSRALFRLICSSPRDSANVILRHSRRIYLETAHKSRCFANA